LFKKILNILQLNVRERKGQREGRGGSTLHALCPILRKNSGETKLYNFVPCVKHLNACIGLIILGLSSPSGPDNRSVLLDGRVSICACIVHVKCCAEIRVVVVVAALEAAVVAVIVVVVAVVVVVAIVEVVVVVVVILQEL
jgi:hypothetical protein